MNRTFCFLFLCSGIFFFSCKSQEKMVMSVHKTEAEQVREFAEQEWELVAKKIPAGMEEAFGFQNPEEIENSTMGEPIKMYYWQDGEMVESADYRVPVLVEGKMVSLLTVSAGGEMTSGDFGGSQLARNIQLLSDHYHVKVNGILRIHLLSSDFLIFEENRIRCFIPVTEKTVRDLSQKNILKLDDIIRITQK